MALFSYRAKNPSGESASGEIEAVNLQNAADKLQETGLFPVIIEQSRTRPANTRKLKKEIPAFTRQLSELISSDVSLVKALGILLKHAKNSDWRKTLASIKEDVEKGTDFSGALSKHAELFDKVYAGIVKAGEDSGTLGTSLERLAEFHEKRIEIIGRIKSTLAYPAAVFSIGILTLGFLVVFVIPRFAVMFEDVGRTLPLPTRILIFASDAARFGWWLYLPAGAAAYFYLNRFLGTEKGRIAFEKFKLSLPVAGDIMLYTIVTRFCLTMGTLLKNGIPLLDSVKYAQDASGSILIKRDTEKIIKTITGGSGVALGFHGSEIFPPGVVDMISIGEESGQLDKMLLRVADFYSKEADVSLKRVMSLIEPAIIVFMGLLVGFIVISVLLPVFDLGGMVR